MSDQIRESTSVLSGALVDVRSWRHHHEGTNDYTNSWTDIVEIVDRHDHIVEPVWGPDWLRVADGVETRSEGHTCCLRIHADACPVRVRFHDVHEYVSYTDSEHSSSSTREYWVRYVRG